MNRLRIPARVRGIVEGGEVTELQYFTHVVDGHLYGAWYRQTSAHHIEVIGVGLLEAATYAGFSPETTAKSVLENHVRQQLRIGTPMPTLETSTQSVDDPLDPNDPETAEPPPAISTTRPICGPRT